VTDAEGDARVYLERSNADSSMIAYGGGFVEQWYGRRLLVPPCPLGRSPSNRRLLPHVKKVESGEYERGRCRRGFGD